MKTKPIALPDKIKRKLSLWKKLRVRVQSDCDKLDFEAAAAANRAAKELATQICEGLLS